MLLPPCRLVVFDSSENALLSIEGTSGHVLSRFRVPSAYRPLALLPADTAICFFANSRTDGAVYTLQGGSWSRLPITLPIMTAVCSAPNEEAFYLASARHTLYHLDTRSGKLTSLGSAPHTCRALAKGIHLASVWETTEGSICALHNNDGTILSEHHLDGTIPTATIAGTALLLPFTNGKKHGEGLHLLPTDTPAPTVTTISLKSPSMRGLSIDPYSVLPTENALCLISESSGTITKLDRLTGEIIDSYSIGRSISNLYLLPDERFAVATSNMFADLSLVDLVNEKLLSVSICAHELFHQLVILPPT